MTLPHGRAPGLVLGYAADSLLGDPARWHPVAALGRTAAALERVTYADRRAPGAVHVTLLVGGAAALGAWVPAALAPCVVPGRLPEDPGAPPVEAFRFAGDPPPARERLTHLVVRDTSELDES